MTAPQWFVTEFTLTSPRGRATVRRDSEDRWTWRVHVGTSGAFGTSPDYSAAQGMALKALEVLE